ncbi:MAG: uroporphyrinogen-III synthase [Hyphomicrobiaceae bacterium]|nr:uroporphyrinogen-III synthase [Hyphomicrobiaceae bacterium]
MHVLITRPEPDASHWRDRLKALGIASTVDPMLDIVIAPPAPVLQSEPGQAGQCPQALVITSRNAVRWLEAASDLAAATALPVYTVGPGSTAAIRALGFSHIIEGAATARDLAPIIASAANPHDGPLLHLSGDKLAFDLAPPLAERGLSLRRRIVYHSRPAATLRPATRIGIENGTIDAVVLLSPLTATTYIQLMAEAGLVQHHQRLVYVCLSQVIGQIVAGCGPHEVIVAAAPNAQAVFGVLERRSSAHRAC